MHRDHFESEHTYRTASTNQPEILLGLLVQSFIFANFLLHPMRGDIEEMQFYEDFLVFDQV